MKLKCEMGLNNNNTIRITKFMLLFTICLVKYLQGVADDGPSAL